MGSSLEYNKEYYKKYIKDPENLKKNRERSKAYYYANKEKELEKRRQYRKNNRAKLNKKNQDWYYSNLEKARFQKVKAKFKKQGINITYEEYTALKEKQNNQCAICGAEPTTKSLAIDHCHETNEIRGLLCHSCNRGIGLLQDSPDILREAIKYLE